MIDAFDTLFQRSLQELQNTYEQLVAKTVKTLGIWPVLFGGEMNCWPFPHNGSIHVRRRSPQHGNRNGTWLYQVRRGAMVKNHSCHTDWKYPYTRRSSGHIAANEVCAEWLFRHSQPLRILKAHQALKGHQADKAPFFPFVNAGAMLGRAETLLRIIDRMFSVFEKTGEMDDQALLTLTLLQNPELGLVDVKAEAFLNLHGVRRQDAERNLCEGGHFAKNSDTEAQFETWPFQNVPPRLRHSDLIGPPAVLHFNGNGKRIFSSCIDSFVRASVIERIDCTFFDEDLGWWRIFKTTNRTSVESKQKNLTLKSQVNLNLFQGARGFFTMSCLQHL